MIRNTVKTWGRLSIILHWLTALLIAGLGRSGFDHDRVTDIPDEDADLCTAQKFWPDRSGIDGDPADLAAIFRST